MVLLKPIIHSHVFFVCIKESNACSDRVLAEHWIIKYVQYLPTVLIIMLLQQWNYQRQKHKIHLLIPHLFLFLFVFISSSRLVLMQNPTVNCVQADRKAFILLRQQIFYPALFGSQRHLGCTGRSFVALHTVFRRAAFFVCEGRQQQQQSAVRLPRSSQQELISPLSPGLCGALPLTLKVH